MDAEKLPTYARGWRLDEKEILEALERWEKRAVPLMDGCILFYCYGCGIPKYASEKMLLRGQRPKCPICKNKIDIYDVDVLRRRRKELAGNIRTALSRGLLRIFSEAAERCGGIKRWVKRWALLTNGILEVDGNCAKFWYDPRSPIRSVVDTAMRAKSRRYLGA